MEKLRTRDCPFLFLKYFNLYKNVHKTLRKNFLNKLRKERDKVKAWIINN